MPDWKHEVRTRLSSLHLSPTREAEIVDEILQHIEEHHRDLIAGGASGEEATRLALAELRSGDVLARYIASQQPHAAAITPGVSTGHVFTDLWQDLRHAARVWSKQPGFTTVALISLALGIGANTAIFSLVDAVLLRELPVPDPQQLLEVSRQNGGTLSYPMYEIIRDRNQVFSGVLVTPAGRLTASARSGDVDLHDIHVSPVSNNYFRVLGIPPVMGRDLGEDDSSGATTAVVSYGLWQRGFGADPAVLGKEVRIGERAYTIAGVAPSGFTGISAGQPVDLWIPIITRVNKQELSNPVALMFRVMARRRGDVSEEQARANIDLLARRWSADWKFELPMKVDLISAGGGFTQLRRRFSTPLFVLMTIVACLLLIAATNVGSLLLARASARQKEMAVRLSLGASRSRLIRQLLTESLLLGGAGGALGLFLAPTTAAFLARFLSSPGGGVELSFAIDGRMLAFTLFSSVIVVLVFGLAPALVATRLDLSPVFKSGTSASGRTVRARGKFLVLAEVSVSCVLLVGGVLFARSLQELTNVDAGFQSQNVMLLQLNTRGTQGTYDVLQRILERLSRIPGVVATALSSEVLFSGNTWTEAVSAPGFVPRRGEDREAVLLVVSPGFFRTMGTSILQGRDFDDRDGERSSRVAIVNEAMARYYFGRTDVLGKTFQVEHRDFSQPLTVVGIVQDAKYWTLRDAAPRMVYLPYQNPGTIESGNIAVRTTGDPEKMIDVLLKETQSERPFVRVGNVTTQARLVNGTIAQDRMLAQLSGFFALAATILVCIGVYGLTAFDVSRRTSEIGVRIALGAQHRDVMRTVLKTSMGLVGTGVALGLVASFGLARMIESLLFGVKSSDVLTMLLSAGTLLSVGVGAAYLPARRAARLDPITSIKYE
jgi:predicted permease